MLSKALLVGAYQKKLEEMAANEGVNLTVAVPPSWDDPRGGVRLEKVHTAGYEMIDIDPPTADYVSLVGRVNEMSGFHHSRIHRLTLVLFQKGDER